MSRSGVSVPAASRGWRAAILLLLLWVGGGCLFSTRDPQTPAPEGGDSSFRDPTVPDTVLRNVRFAIRQENVSNYSRSLADSFTFVPDPDDAALIGEDFFANWSRDQDQTVFSTIFTQADSIRPGRITRSTTILP